MSDSSRTFLVARNPEADSRLPYLLRLPLEDGLVLKARERWPATARVYCHLFGGAWPENAEIVEQTPVRLCRRRGAAIDWCSTVPGLPAPSSSSPRSRVARRSSGKRRRPPANPGGRIPRRQTLAGAITITVDTRERYPYRFAQQAAETVRETVPAGDYAVRASNGSVLAAVERKSLDNLAATLSDGTLAFQMQRLSELPLAAVVVEARYSALFKLEHVNGNWLADQLARLGVRYPEVHLVFADSRRFAEDWTYRFLTTALADTIDPSTND